MNVPADLLAYLQTIQADKALTNSFKARNPEFISILRQMVAEDSRPEPLPAFDRLQAIELTIFDNWPTGKSVKYKRSRYGFTLQAAPKGKTIDFEQPSWKWPIKFVGSLMEGDALQKRGVELQSSKLLRPISDEYALFLNKLPELLPGYHFGILESKRHGDGTYLPECQVIALKLTSGPKPLVSHAVLWQGLEDAELPSFSPTDASKKALKKGARLQCRYSGTDKLAKWATPKVETSIK